MSNGRFLFVVPPFTGHVNPSVSVGQVLRARGHQVAWVGHPGKVRPLLPPRARLFALDDYVPKDHLEAVHQRARTVRGLAALKFLWEDFLLPLARASLDGVSAAVERFRPGVMVVDQQALAGALVARCNRIRWATFCTTSAGVTQPLRGLPRVQEWLHQRLDALQAEVGLPSWASPDLSPNLTVVFSSLALVGGDPHRFPETMHFVGPATPGRPSNGHTFPWEALMERPRILVSLGTVNMDRGERFYRVVMEAVRDRPVQVIMVAPESLRSEAPDNVLIESYVPQLALLPHLDAVVCHGGHNTVCETLQQGLPLVVSPIRDDQPIVTEQVVDSGTGVRVRFGRVGPRALWEAIEAVLTDPSFKAAARAIRGSFATAGGARRAADLLEALS